MARDETTETTSTGTNESGGLTVVTIPRDQAPAVLQLVANLQRGDEEVAGHMISGGMIGGFGGTLSAVKKYPTDTGCTNVQSKDGTDFPCTDRGTDTTRT